MAQVRKVLVAAGLAVAALWTLGLGLFGGVVLFIAPPVGLVALGIAALPLGTIFCLWVSRAAEVPRPGGIPQWRAGHAPDASMMVNPSCLTRPGLECALISALDLAAPLAGPGPQGPWMPVDVASPTPTAMRVMQAEGIILPMLAEAGIVLAGPGPGLAVRHMIAAYPTQVAERALSVQHPNRLGAFGAQVAAMQRVPDAHPVGEVRTTIRVVAANGIVSHVVVWRRGPVVAHLSVTGDEQLAAMMLGHATQVADHRLAQLLAGVVAAP